MNQRPRSTSSSSFVNFSDIFKTYTTENLDDINVYGVITFISSNQKKTYQKDLCTLVTLVDPTCGLDEKLKVNVFQHESDLTTIRSSCEIGDIIRLQRVKIQTYNGQPQGVSTSKSTNWVRFKLIPDTASDEFAFESNRALNTINDKDKQKVNEIREWLKTNPANQHLYEAKLSIAPQVNTTIDPIQQVSMAINNCDDYKANYRTISSIKNDGFYDLICQVCAICDVNATKFIIVWDSTKACFSPFRESEFTIESTSESVNDGRIVYFSKQALEYLYNVYLFDEFENCINQLKPGDYILLKNAQARPVGRESSEIMIKMPGTSKMSLKFGRTLTVLGSLDDLAQIDAHPNFGHLDAHSIGLVKQIYDKGKQLQMSYVDKDQFYEDYVNTSWPCDAQKSKNTPVKQTRQPVVLLSGEKRRSNSSEKQTPTEKSDDDKQILNPQRSPIIHLIKYVPSIQLNKQSPPKSDSNETKEQPNKPEMNRSLNDSSLRVDTRRRSARLSRKENLVVQKSPAKQTTDKNHDKDSNANLAKPQAAALTIDGTLDEESITRRSIVAQSTQVDSEINPQHNQQISNSQQLLKNSKPLSNDEDIDEEEEEDVELNKSKKLKQLDAMEICPQMEKLKYLGNLTYFVPYCESPQVCGVERCVPHFVSLSRFTDEARKRNYLKAQVTAKIYGYSTVWLSSLIGSVFVHCKKCFYVNFVPFHLMNIYQPDHLKRIVKQLDKECESSATQLDSSSKKAVNFSIDWLRTAMPVEIAEILPTQVVRPRRRLTNEGDTDDQILPTAYKYACPRCEFGNEPESTLDYIYRFWFKLRDGQTILEPCLIEADVALKFLDSISPLKFLTNRDKSHAVFKLIHRNMDHKYLFTMETFKLSKPSSKSTEGNRRPEILYKIIDFKDFYSEK